MPNRPNKSALLRAVAGFLQAWERHAIRQSVGVIAVCRALQEIVEAGAPGKLVARIEDVTLLDGGRAALVPPLPEAPRPLVLYVGNLERYQGIDLLLEAERVLGGRTAPTIGVNIEAAGESFALRVTAAASDLTEVYPAAEGRSADVLIADSQLWAASYLAQLAGGSVRVDFSNGTCEWTFTVPAAVPANA